MAYGEGRCTVDSGDEDIVMKCDEATMRKDIHTTKGKGKG